MYSPVTRHVSSLPQTQTEDTWHASSSQAANSFIQILEWILESSLSSGSNITAGNRELSDADHNSLQLEALLEGKDVVLILEHYHNKMSPK